LVYADADGDGYGDPSTERIACDGPAANEVDNALDCDDSNAEISPDGYDACGGTDDDCDGEPGAYGCLDNDGDGFGGFPQRYDPECKGFADNCNDCDDTDAARNPDVVETENGVDDNCDGKVDNLPPTPDSGDTGDSAAPPDDTGEPPKDGCDCGGGSGASLLLAIGAMLARRRERRVLPL
jgi:hypothetical protein